MLVDVLRREQLPPGARGLDLCTGSGVLAIAAAQAGCRHVTAVDISRRATLAARLGGRLNGHRIDARCGDLYDAVPGERFELIVSNPPYVPTPSGALPRHGLARAWEGGRDGRELLDRICAGVRVHLRPGGVVLLVHSAICGEDESLTALTAQGLEPAVVARHVGPLGPILRGRADWLRREGHLASADQEEMLVIRAVAPADIPLGPPDGDPGGRLLDRVTG